MPIKAKIKKIKVQEKAEETTGNDTLQPEIKLKRRKGCLYCEGKVEPSFTDSVSLRKFLSDRSRIVPKYRSGICSRHQRKLTREIKRARHMALLPFIARV